jgi:hypothetical protein
MWKKTIFTISDDVTAAGEIDEVIASLVSTLP